MPPIDPRRIGTGLPSGSMPVGTRASDPYAGERVAVSRASQQNTAATDAAQLEIARKREAREAAQAVLENKKRIIELEKLQQKQAVRDPIEKLITVIDAAATGHKRIRQGGAAGNSFTRTVGAYLPFGSSANDLAGEIQTVTGNTAVDTLMQMRQESPTGGALGNVSDKDIDLLRSLQGSFDPKQSNDKLKSSFEKTLKNYQKVLYKIPGGKEAYHEWRLKWLGYDPEKKKGGGVSDEAAKYLKQYGAD